MCDAPAPNELLCIYEWMIFDIFTTSTPIHGHRSHPSYYSDIVMVSGLCLCAVLYLHTFHEAKSKQRNLFCFFLSITKFMSETKIALTTFYCIFICRTKQWNEHSRNVLQFEFPFELFQQSNGWLRIFANSQSVFKQEKEQKKWLSQALPKQTKRSKRLVCILDLENRVRCSVNKSHKEATIQRGNEQFIEWKPFLPPFSMLQQL